MYVPDYYNPSDYETYLEENKFTYSSTDFICELPECAQDKIRYEIEKVLMNEGYEPETEEFEEMVDDAMNSRLWTIEDYVDIDDILGEE